MSTHDHIVYGALSRASGANIHTIAGLVAQYRVFADRSEHQDVFMSLRDELQRFAMTGRLSSDWVVVRGRHAASAFTHGESGG
jgi:hypothetical protein